VRYSRLRVVLEREVPGLPEPKRRLEQYRTPPELALEIVSKLPRGCSLVVDLGSGTGMLSYAASLARGVYAVGVEVDPAAAEAARRSSLYRESIVDFVVADASRLPLRRLEAACVVQNPPFGVVRRGADRLFVEAAAWLGARVILSLHLYSERAPGFLRGLYRRLGYEPVLLGAARFPIPQLYRGHAKRIHYASVVEVLARRVEEDGGS
jgi:putative methylase